MLQNVNAANTKVTAQSKPERETQKNTPAEKNGGRNQSISEKALESDSKKNGQGASDDAQKANKDETAKNDRNTQLAKANSNIIKQTVNSSGIMGMVNSAFGLVDSIAGMLGTTSKPRITNSIKGTVVRVGTGGTFVSYGGHYIGNGSTPNIRNAVVEVMIEGSKWTYDYSKKNGGKAYIFDGDFEANGGANVFNMCQGIGEKDLDAVMYNADSSNGAQNIKITYDEHYGVEQLFYENQVDTEAEADEPVNTANVQVRGGTFRCSFDAMNMAKLEPYNEGYGTGDKGKEHFNKFPGTFGSVNLGVDSFGADLIRDGRIQLLDNADGCLVLMDDQENGYNGLYHYRLFCGDNELRTKSYLKVYPNEAANNASFSMQLAYYLGTGHQTNDLFKDDEEGNNIRSPYRQMESYFDFQIDDYTNRPAYSVKPNFHYRKNKENEKKNQAEWDVYGESVATSEVWYYPTPLDKEGNPIKDTPYSNAIMYFNADDSVVKSMTGWIYNKSAKYVSQYTNVSKNEFGQYVLMDRDVLDDEIWPELIDKADSVPAVSLDTYEGIHTNMKYFTYKVYQVDPLTRENLNANRSYGGDDPLITVRYGCAPEETALKCKLPLDEVERRIKNIHPEWQGYRAGEMYRIVLEVEEQVGIGEKPLNRNGYTIFGFEGFNDFGQKLRTAKTTTSILFRCYEKAEQYRNIETDGGTTYEHKYLDTDFTPVQWLGYPTHTHTIPAGQKHTVEVRNGKTGMTDWECDTRVFDMYYQWWEVDKEGNPLKLLAGTDNVFVDGLDKHDERGTSYMLDAKAKHKPDSWDFFYKKKDGSLYQYANTVDSNDPHGKEYYQNDPETYPNITGLPKITENGQWKWTAEQIHMYSAETTDSDDLFIGKVHSLENNKIDANRTDSCYIPKEMIGKRIRVCVIALNTRWPLAYDKKQTFWSHTMMVCDPKSPEGYLTVETDEDEEFGEDVPATFSVQKLRDCYDEYNMVCDITYVAYGKYKSFCYDTKNLITDLSALPTAHYPKDFTDQRPDYVIDNDIFGDVGVVLHFTDKDRLAQVRARTEDYTTSMITSSDWLTLPPDLYGTFTIRDNLNSDPNEKDHPATFSVTALNGLNAGETISGVDLYAFGKVKSFTDLSIYDPKDLPEARYPVGFTEISTKPRFAQYRGEVVVRVTTSKGSEPYRTVYLTEEKPTLTGTVNITYDEDLSYATYDHPVKLSLDDFKGLAYNEEITEVHYKLQNRDEEKVFSTADNPDVFKNGIPSATFPNDFYEEGSAGWNSNRTYTPYVTVVVRRNTKSQKAVTTGKELELGKSTGIVQGTAVRTDIGTGTGLELGTAKRIELGSDTVIESETGTGIERALTGSTGLGTKISGIIRKNDDEIREETFAPTNYARFQYVVKATSVERSGKEVETVTVSDIQNGKYPYGIEAFYVMPPTAKIGYDFTDNTNTNENVAALNENGNIKLTGEPGEATFSMQSPDGETVTKTVRVYQDFDSIEISGIKAPVIGEKFDFDSIKVPEDAPYRISKVEWSRRWDTLGADDVAENYYPYTVSVTVEPKEFCELNESDASYRVITELADGSTELVKDIEIYDVYEEGTSQRIKSAKEITYTFPAQSDHTASEVSEVHIDFPTEVKEGTYWDEWVKDVNVCTNGFDEGFTFEITPGIGSEAEKTAAAYNCDPEDLKRFVKGVQNSLTLKITIPDELKANGDSFSKDVSFYVNGEKTKPDTAYSTQIFTTGIYDCLTVTEGEPPAAMPKYSLNQPNALVVGEPIDMSTILNCDDPNVSFKFRSVTYNGKSMEEYFDISSNEETGSVILTPKTRTSDSIDLNYTVSADPDKDGTPDYEVNSCFFYSKIYADASEAPEPDKTHTGTARLTLLDPDGKEVSKADYAIRTDADLPAVENAFISGCYDAEDKSVKPSQFENGKRYTVKTISADAIEVHAGTETVYGFVKSQDGKDISDIQISVDRAHFTAGDHISGLTPDTEYTLYYRQGVDGTLYTTKFRTAKQEYGVFIGRQPVTGQNLGDLDTDGWTYDPDKKILTLKDFSLNDSGTVGFTEKGYGVTADYRGAIVSQDELTVKLIGDNSIQTGKECVIYADKSLTIEGNGNLKISGGIDGLYSRNGSIYLDETGTLTFNKIQIGLSANKGIIEYTNGTIEFYPKLTSVGETQYAYGSLAADAKISFSGKLHDLSVLAGSKEEEIAEVTEEDLTEAMKSSYLTITPQHKTDKQTESAETHDSGSCDSGATYHLSCECGHISEETFEAPAGEHVLVKHDAKPATCAEAGTAAYWECEHCGECYADEKGTKPLTDESIVIPALGHKMTHHAAVEATCTKAGSIEYWTCDTCGERFGDENGSVKITATDITVSATGHEWIQVFSTPATCDKDGKIEHWECKNCGQLSADKDGTKLLKKEDVVIKAFGHTWSEWTLIKEESETAEGERVRSCSVCGETETKVIPKLTTTTTAATTTTTTTTTISTTKPTTTTTTTTISTTKPTTTTTTTTISTTKPTTTTTTTTKPTTTTTTTTSTTKPTATTTTTTSTTKKTTTTTTTTSTTKPTTTTTTTTTSTTKPTTTTTTTTKPTTTTTTTTSTTKPTTTTITTTKATTTTTTTSTTKATTTTTTTTSTTKATTTTTTTSATKATTTASETTTRETTTTVTMTSATVTSESESQTSDTTVTSETTPTEPEFLRGDVNGDGKIGVDDAQTALIAYTEQFAGNPVDLTDIQRKAVDVNEDGKLNVDDAQNILIYYTETKVAGKVLTWEDLLGNQKQAQPRPVPQKLPEDFLTDFDKWIPGR